MGLLSKLQEEVHKADAGSATSSNTVNFRITVANWGRRIIHAVLFYLCRVRPCTPIRALFNEQSQYTVSDAVKMLWFEHNSLFPLVTDKVEVWKLLHLCRFGHSAPLLQHAERAGFDVKEVEVKEAMNAEGGVPTARAPIHSMLHSIKNA